VRTTHTHMPTVFFKKLQFNQLNTGNMTMMIMVIVVMIFFRCSSRSLASFPEWSRASFYRLMQWQYNKIGPDLFLPSFVLVPILPTAFQRYAA